VSVKSIVSDNAVTAFPDNFVQSGSNIDIEIAMRLTRSMWKAIADADTGMRDRLNANLQEEIDSLALQHEIDRSQDDDTGLAVARLLSQYLLPIV
jgi:hypothetical protein